MADLPSSTSTFLFTDIEGSTQLWERFPEAMPLVLAAHDAALKGAIEAHHGEVVKWTGDGVLAAFPSAADGTAAALAAQRSLRAQETSRGDAPRIRVRMGLHSGEAQARDGDYFGGTLNRTARLMAIGHGGQVLLSEATSALVRERLPIGAALVAMGEHRLKDLTQPEHIYQLNVPDLQHEFPPLASLGIYRHNLPVQLTSFIGREAELAEVIRLIAGTRLLTLIGPGGTGKTRLSMQAAAELLDQFADGAWLVELAPVSEAVQVEQAIARVFGVHEQPGVTPAQALDNYVRYKQLLLVLDNCEHLIGTIAQIAQRLLQTGPRVKIISSSREGLAIAGETIYQVPSLALPPEGNSEPDLLVQVESVRLFVERAQAVAPSFVLSAENAPSVAEICRRLDGIPLAIELAAVRTRLLSPAQIAVRLRDHFRLLAGGSRTALPRQQTLQALIDWSWDLLGEPERAVLRRLSVFTGSWTLEAAEAVLPQQDEALEVLEELSQLVNKSLVVVGQRSEGARYHLLETIRQYARDKLTAAHESAALHERHARYYARLAAEYEPHVYGSEMALWLERFDTDAANFGAAYDWLLEGAPLSALNLANITSFAAQCRGRMAEWDRRLTEAISRVRGLPAPDSDERRQALALGLAYLATICLARGEMRRGREAVREAVQLAREIGNQATLAFALGNASVFDLMQGDYATGEAEAHESAALSREGASPVRFGRAGYASFPLSTQALIHAMRGGERAVASALADEAMRMARSSASPWVKGMVAMTAARVAGVFGDLPAARALSAEGITNFDHVGDPYFKWTIIAELAHILRHQGLRDEARATYRQTIRRFQESGNRGALAHQLECFAMLALDDGKPDPAARLFGAAQYLREQASSQMMAYERVDYDSALVRLRSALAAEALERVWNEGARLPLEQAIELAIC